MAKMLTCPCGEQIRAADTEIVEKVNGHLAANHEGRTYPAEAILAMASDISDAQLND